MNRPTEKELGYLLEATSRKQYLLLGTLLNIDFFNGDLPVATPDVLTCAVFDWMTALNALQETDRQRLILINKPVLLEVADKFDREEQTGGRYSISTLAIFDFRFVAIKAAWMDTAIPILDLQTGKHIDKLPHHTLTGLSCDLNVLLLRLFDRMQKVRQLQETAHADNANPAIANQPPADPAGNAE